MELKSKSLGKAFVAGMLIIASIIFAYLGVYAIKKGFSISMTGKFFPSVRCEIYVTPNGESERLIFSNLSGREYIHNDWQLYSNTSTLKYTPRMEGTIGFLYTMRVVNYTTGSYVYAGVSGGGVTENSVVLNPYNNVPEEADADILLISAVSADFNINFIKLHNYYITPTFEHVTFDLNAENNTLIKFENNYYIPLGENATTTIVPETNYEYATLTGLTIGGVNKLADYFDSETNVLNIPSANINGQILTTGGIYPFDISFNAQGGTGGTSSTTAYLGHTPSSSITPPTKTNYTFGGYYYDNNLDSYVQDNMLMWLDGIYNNGVGNSHSTTAETWRDISGNNLDCGFNGTEPTWNSTNGISLDGDEDGIYIGDQLLDLFKSSNTCEFLFKRLDNDRGIIMGNYIASLKGNTNNYEIYDDNNLRIYFNAGANEIKFSNDTVLQNEYVSLTFVFDKPNGLAKIYKNGTLLHQNSYAGYTSYNYDFPKAWIGKDNRINNNPVVSLKANFYSFRAYNRILTATEVAQNYETDIARYGTSGTQTVVSPTQIFNASGIGSAIWNYARNSILYARWS